MAFIGKKPTAAPLTSSDVTDGIISTAKIADNAVTAAKTVYKDVPFRNILINGDMSIAQRSTSASSIASNGYHACDRWRYAESSSAVVTISQDTDVPSGYGFFNSLKIDCTTVDSSLGASEYVLLQHKIEGQNLQYLKKGTSSAESLTLSFWVKSTKTGTFIATLYDRDNTRQIAKSYTVSSTNTWEQKEITYAGDTTGAFGNDNASSLELWLWLAAGSDSTEGTLATSWASYDDANSAVGQVNAVDSTSNNFLITGVQLEAGTSASDFEFLPYDVNLRRCQRYFQLNLSGVGYSDGDGDQAAIIFPLQPDMRATPTGALVTGTGKITDFYVADRNISSLGAAFGSQGSRGTAFLVNGTYTNNKPAGVHQAALSFDSEL